MAPQMTMEERLNAMTDQFKVARNTYNQRFGGLKIDEAEYIGQLQKCALGVRKSDNCTTMNVEFLIQAGKFKGFVAYDSMNLDSDWGKVFAIRFCEISGYKFPEDNMAKLIPTCKKISSDKSKYKFLVTHGEGGYANVQVQGIVKGEKLETEDPSKKETVRKKTVTKPVETGTTELNVDYPDFDTFDRKELKKYIRENELGIRVVKDMKDSDIVTTIKEKLGIIPDGIEDVKKTPDDDDLKNALLTLCVSRSIKNVKKDMDLDDMIDIVEEYSFDQDDLEDDEKELLQTLQLDHCIE